MSPDRSTAHQPDPDGPDGGREPSMRAVVQDRHGSAEVLRLSRVPSRSPGTTRCWSGCTRPASTAAPGT